MPKMPSSSILVKESVFITPLERTPTQILPLSSLDSQLFLRFTIEYLLVYKSHHALDKNAIIAHVKFALARALVPYYPLAGRVRARADGTGLEVVCRAQGAAFIQAVSDYSPTDFDRAPQDVTEWQDLLSLQVVDVLKGAPPLVVQLTWLSDRSATLAFGFNHCLCDGIGSLDFLNLFSHLAAGKSRLNELNSKLVWERHLLDPISRNGQIHQRKFIKHPEFRKVDDLCNFNSRFSQERLIPTSVIFNKRRLNELKKLTSQKDQSLCSTSFEVLSAHIWRSWAKSLNFPPNQTIKLLFSINIRKRVKPNLPNGYYGNAFVLGCAETTVKDLVEKGLGYGSLLVKKAKERVDDEYVREVLELVNSGDLCPDSVGVLILSQWSRLGLENIDFGMGRPVNVGPICVDRYCILLPVCDQKDSVKVNVALPESAVDKYLCLLKSAGNYFI